MSSCRSDHPEGVVLPCDIYKDQRARLEAELAEAERDLKDTISDEDALRRGYLQLERQRDKLVELGQAMYFDYMSHVARRRWRDYLAANNLQPEKRNKWVPAGKCDECGGDTYALLVDEISIEWKCVNCGRRGPWKETDTNG